MRRCSIVRDWPARSFSSISMRRVELLASSSRAARRRASTPLPSSAPTLEALAERVVEQDAPALLGEERREVREELGHAARRPCRPRSAVSALTGKTTGSFTSLASSVRV